MEASRHWRTQDSRYRLSAAICKSCNAYMSPPRDRCVKCGSDTTLIPNLSGRGEVYSYSTLFNPPSDFTRFGPYSVALVKLDEGPMVTAQLADVDASTLRIGARVEMVLRRLRDASPSGVVLYGYKFRPGITATAE